LKFYESVKDKSLRAHYAQGASLLAGDLVLSAAHRLLDQTEVPDVVKKIFHEAMFKVIGGELLDTEAAFSTEHIDLQLVAETKTASYSLIGPLASGATLAGASSEQITALRELGRLLGIGFQIADDLLVFREDFQIGKSADSDLAEGKRTIVVAEALALMTPVDRARAEELLSNPSSQHISELRELIINTDILNVLNIKLTDIEESAQVIIQQLKIDQTSKQSFVDLAHLLLKREA
jgi:geranylgeranyl pyrophosphate synthase